MSKTGLIISREYLSRVKKKSFLLTTIGVPVLIMAFYALIVFIAVKGDSSQQKIAVIDEAGLFTDSIAQSKKISFELIKSQQHDAFVKQYRDKGFDALLYVPKLSLDSPKGVTLHTKNNASVSTLAQVERLINTTIENKRMVEKGIDPMQVKQIKSDINVTNTIDSETGSRKTNAWVAYAVAMFCGILIYMMMILYGTQVMRGVSEEKTSRIAEVVVSSAKPFELMLGKIIGIGLVGLTQFAIWIVLMLVIQSVIGMFMPGVDQKAIAEASSGENINVMAEVTAGLSSLPLLKIGLVFAFYFIGGYLTYASLFAAVGSVVSDDQNEAQSLVFPILMPIILGFVIMMQALNDPNSSLAVFGSMFPLTSPVVMIGRIAFEVPWWQLGLSMALLVLCFLFFAWLSARIYRVGILMYGKKPSWKEMIKWAFTK